MIQIPDEIKTLFKQDSIRKNIRVKFPNGEFRDLVNTDIVSESVIFTESVSSGDGLKFGLCEGAHIEFDTYFNQNIRNLQIYAQIEIDISSCSDEFIAEYGSSSDDVDYPYYSIPYGYFYVDSCKRDCANNVRRVVAYQNKYDNRLLSGDLTAQLTPFEQLKLCSTATRANVDYDMNYPMVFCSMFNNPEILDEFGITYDFQTDFDFSVEGRFNQSKGATIMTSRQIHWIQSPFFYEISTYLTVYYKEFIFTSLVKDPTIIGSHDGIGDKCPGKYMFKDSKYITESGSWQASPQPYYAPMFPQRMYQFSVDYGDTTPLEIVSHYKDVINGYIADEEANLSTADAYRLLCPIVNAVGQCSDGRQIQNGVISKPTSRVIDDTDTNNSTEDLPTEGGINPFSNSRSVPYASLITKPDESVASFILDPWNPGCTDYEGKKLNQYDVYDYTWEPGKLGCVGYSVCIPYRIVINTFDNEEYTLNLDETFLDVDDISVKVWWIDGCEVIPPYTEPPNWSRLYGKKIARVEQNAAGYNASTDTDVTDKVYDGTSILLSAKSASNDQLNLQQALEDFIELKGKFGRFDRKTNQLSFLALQPSNALYPSPDIYPAMDLYPSGPTHFISRSLWKSVWYDDKLTNHYKRVIVTWKREEEDEKSYAYTIIPDSDIINEKDFQDYELSNNYYIQNGLIDDEAIQQTVDALGEYLKTIQYYVSDIEMRALPYMEAGDEIVVATNEGGFSTFCLRHRISGIHALMDSIEAR